MDAQIIASVFDNGITIAGGVLAGLMGSKVIYDKTGNPKYDQWYAKWGKHMRWMGPAMIGFALLQIALKVFGSR